MWRTSKGGGLLENRGQQWNNMEKKSRKMRRERAKRRGRKNWNAHRKDAQVLARHMQGHADGRGGWRGGGAQVTSPSHPSTSIYVDGDGLSGEWAAPVHLGHPPLIPFLFPPSASTCFFFFPFPIPITRTQWRGQSWVRTPYGVFLFLFFVVTRRWNIAPGLLIPNDRLLIQHVLRLIPCIVKTQ